MHPFPHHNPRCQVCGGELPALLHARYCDDCWKKMHLHLSGQHWLSVAAACDLVRRLWRSLRQFFRARRPPGVN